MLTALPVIHDTRTRAFRLTHHCLDKTHKYATCPPEIHHSR